MVIRILIALLPVVLFLVALVFMDTYRLLKPSRIVGAVMAGAVAAVVSLAANTAIMTRLSVPFAEYTQAWGPFVEETIKASYIFFLVRTKRIGFLVDAAIYGTAVGAGFAVLENMYNLAVFQNPNFLLWLVRGVGTGLMHGGSTAMCAVMSRRLIDIIPRHTLWALIPGLALAFAVHAAFNRCYLDPVVSTIFLVVVLPLLMASIFNRSEVATRRWLGSGLDLDFELLNAIMVDDLASSKVGGYIRGLRTNFPPLVVGDMLCYARLFTELSMQAKGVLILRQAGFFPPKDPATRECLKELKYLEKSIGHTGRLAIAPMLRMSSRSLWQLQMLEE